MAAPPRSWSEALRNWLTIQDLAAAEAATDPSLGRLDARRAQAWQAIDATLFALRASSRAFRAPTALFLTTTAYSRLARD